MDEENVCTTAAKGNDIQNNSVSCHWIKNPYN